METPRPEYVCFDRAAAFYESTRHIPPECLAAVAGIIAADAPSGRGPFLDAGIGTGRFARPLAAAGLRVIGADISAAMLREARARGGNEHLVRADLRALPFSAAAFAGALCVHILHLIARWQDVVAEARRVIRPGAALYVGSESGKRFRSLGLYHQVAEERGLTRPPLGAPSLDAILGHLADTGAALDRLDDGRVTWTARVTAAALIRTIHRNPFSHMWHVPPDVHAGVAEETERRIREAFASIDDLDEAPAHFVLWRARW